jgi:polar amino acid transport system substrate-binding protein
MAKLIELLKTLPAPLSTAGNTLEKLVEWYGHDRAPAFITGIVFGAAGLGAVILGGYLPVSKFGYLSNKDAMARLEEQQKDYEERLKDERKNYEARLRESKEDTLGINPNDSVIISPIGYMRFEWTGPVDVSEYTLTLLGPDSTANGLRSQEIQIKGARPVLSGTAPSAEVPRPTRELKYVGLSIPRFGEYFWSIKEFNSPRKGGNYRRFSIYESSLHKIEQTRTLNTGTSLVLDEASAKQDFSTSSSDELFAGFEIELIKRLADNLGISTKPEVVVRHIEWDDLLTRLAEDQVDLVVSSMTKTRQRERQYNVLFSDGYFTTHQRFVVRAGQTGCLKGRTVGVVGGNPPTTNQRAAELLSAKFGYEPNLKFVPNTTELFAQIIRGSIDAGLVDDMSAREVPGLEFLGGNLDQVLTASGFYGPDIIGYPQEEFAIAVPGGEHNLLDKINALLASMKRDGTLQKMQDEVRPSLLRKVGAQRLC